jgi:hypothetical protein
MIKDPEYWKKWEAEFIASEPVDYRKNVRIMEAMYAEVKAMNLMVPQDPLEGLEADILYAKAINVPTSPHPNRPGA